MRIGVISDTHDNQRNVQRIVELLVAARVERVIHTGDFTRPETLELLARVGVPLFGVFGNNDVARDALRAAAARSGAELAAPPYELRWAGRRICVVHDPEAHPGLDLSGCDALLHGHRHRQVIERSGGMLILNPGECAGWLEGHNSVGVLDLARLDVEILRF
jgi:putative phosphoesterase